MALTFPANPTNGQIYDQYVYNSTAQTWRVYGSDTGITNVLATKANLNGGNTFSGYQKNQDNPRFFAKFGSTILGTAASYTKIIFPEAPVNVGNCYNISTGHFTAPIAGTYFFSIKFQKRSSGALTVSWYKNNAILDRCIYVDLAGDSPGPSATLIVDLAANDYISIFYILGAGDIYAGERFTYFTGYLLG